ncbi:MAG TPA: hypothetical protein VGS19_12790 [Streptosporangiaceae bacterium]|nr:hypothetical protein [Streptosporangiaceae bacterium]
MLAEHLDNLAGGAVRSWDGPDRGDPVEQGRTVAGDLRARLDALAPNHPSSPGYSHRKAVDAASGQPGVDRTTPELTAAERRAEVAAVHRPEWADALAARAVERHGDGVLDERDRSFPPGERVIAEALAMRGAAVTALPEDHSLRRRQPDALLDGRVTEFKSLRPGATDATVNSRLLAAKAQAPNVVVDARGSGLAEADADRGIRRFLGSPWGGERYETILVLGDGYVIDRARGQERTHRDEQRA